MELIGHRGCAAQYPENTVLAIRESAVRLNAVEIDVRRCATGELVAFHDERLDRVTDAEGRLAETAYAKLSELEVLDSGESIPLVEEVLEAVPAGVTLQIELKERGLAADLRELLDERTVDHRVASFMPDALAEVRDLGWDVPTGYLFGEKPRANVERAVTLGCEFVHPHHELCLETDVVRTARDEGLGVLAWNTDDPAVVERIRGCGVDGITADRWDIDEAADSAAPSISASD